VVGGDCERGILICGTGLGISIAANKVKGVRCALCSEPVSCRLSREHNDANIVAMGARMIGPVMAEAIVDTFLTTDFLGDLECPVHGVICTVEPAGVIADAECDEPLFKSICRNVLDAPAVGVDCENLVFPVLYDCHFVDPFLKCFPLTVFIIAGLL
jgi:hypothetical protein